MNVIDDSEFIRDSKVPLTKKNIRLLIFAKSNINKNSVVYDIGAGTGGISIDAARNSKIVYAVEKNQTAFDILQKNIEKFKIENIVPINSEAPDGMENLPSADVIFIGGTGGNFESIVRKSIDKLNPSGTIIITAITLQTILNSIEIFSTLKNFSTDAIQVQINNVNRVKNFDMLKAENPIFVFTAKKICNDF